MKVCSRALLEPPGSARNRLRMEKSGSGTRMPFPLFALTSARSLGPKS